MKTIAIIDCGTNTFHLLVARYEENHREVLLQDKKVVNIGRGGINDRLITDDAQQRAITAIQGFRASIDQYGSPKVFAFATSAFRNAENGRLLRDKIQDACNISIQIIEGDQEAEFIFWGVNAAMDLGNSPSLVMDIGGGSVEFIIGKRNEIAWKRSFEIGAQRLLDLFNHHDPILTSEVKALKDYLAGKLVDLFAALNHFRPATLVGSSGTFDTLSAIYSRRKNIDLPAELSETPLPLEDYRQIHAELVSKNREERMQIPGMIGMRVDMIVVASCIIEVLLENHGFEHTRVSTYSLKEGVLAQVVGGKLLR